MTSIATPPPTSPAAAPAPPAIDVYQLSHRFKDRLALRGITLQIPRGSLHGLVGPNGAGKTTLLRILATLLPVQIGSASLLGHSNEHDPDAIRRHMGYMPDGFGLYQQMTVFETLDFFGAGYGLSQAKRDEVIGDLLMLLDLEHRQNDLVGGLSRGLQQRVSLAKTLIHDPEVLLLDEPASGLDPRARIELMEILTGLRRMGKTIIISSHILSELALVCESVTILSRGQLKFTGSMDRLLDHGNDATAYSVILENRSGSAADLARVSGVCDVEECAEPNEFVVSVQDGISGSDLLASFLEAGVRLASFGPARRRLNDVFMELTEQGVT